MKQYNIQIYMPKTKIKSFHIKYANDLYLKNWIETIFFVKGIVEDDKKRMKELNQKWIFVIDYKSDNELIKKIKEYKKENNEIFIHTTDERLIVYINKIKKKLWIETTEKYEAFNNKDLQRDFLLKYNKDITVNYLKINLKRVTKKEINKFWFPFVIKPI